MSAATALAAGDTPLPRLAEAAVAAALARAGADRADAILLYLSEHFARQAEPALKAAARVGACLQVHGGLVATPFTERETVLDRPAAAALVLTRQTHAEAPPPRPAQACLTLRAHTPAAPALWTDLPRYGCECAAGPLWQQGRPAAGPVASPTFPGLHAAVRVSRGLQILGELQEVSTSEGHLLRQVGQGPALEHLRRALPPELRERPPLHTLFALPDGDPAQATALLEAHPDGSLTLARPLPPGSRLAWAARLPLPAERELGEQLADLRRETPRPLFGLMFACLGRGPWFHGGEERNQGRWQATFPDTPLLGAYSNAQIAPLAGGGAQLIHNSVVTTLFSSEVAHVHPLP